MKKKIYTLTFLAGIFMITTSAIVTSGTGPVHGTLKDDGIADHTGNPAYTNTCAECHGGTPNSGGGSITINVKDTKGAVVSAYELNQKYTVEITVAQANITKFGLDAEVVKSNGTNAGAIAASTGLKLMTGSKSTNISHTFTTTSTTSGTYTYSFPWTTPTTDVGEVTVYAAGLAANGNGTESGDKFYTGSKKLVVNNVGIGEAQKAITALTVYPNPVKELLNVSYSLTKAAHVSLSLYAINGQKIAALLNAKQAEGSQKAALNLPASVSNGTYLLQINADGVTSFQKILVSK